LKKVSFDITGKNPKSFPVFNYHAPLVVPPLSRKTRGMYNAGWYKMGVQNYPLIRRPKFSLVALPPWEKILEGIQLRRSATRGGRGCHQSPHSVKTKFFFKKNKSGEENPHV